MMMRPNGVGGGCTVGEAKRIRGKGNVASLVENGKKHREGRDATGKGCCRKGIAVIAE